MTLSPRFRIAAVLALILGGLILHACGAAGPRPDVPAAAEEARLRSLVPPAAAEVASLDQQRQAAELAAAKAKASGDKAAAGYQTALAVELTRLEGVATERKAAQQAEIDRLAADAHTRALAERRELDARAAAAAREADARHAMIVGAIGLAISAALVVVCLKASLPLWLASVPGGAAGAYVAWYSLAPPLLAAMALVGHILGAVLVLAVLAGLGMALRSLWLAAKAGAGHGDRLEAGVVTAIQALGVTSRTLTATAHEEVTRTIAHAIAEAKGASVIEQAVAGVSRVVAAARGKAPA